MREIRPVTRAFFSRPTAEGGHLHTASPDDRSLAHVAPWSQRCGWCVLGAPHSVAEHGRAQELRFEAVIGGDRYRGSFEREHGLLGLERMERKTGVWWAVGEPELLAELAEMAREIAR